MPFHFHRVRRFHQDPLRRLLFSWPYSFFRLQYNLTTQSTKSDFHLNSYSQFKQRNTFLCGKNIPKNSTFKADPNVNENFFGKSRTRLRDLHFGHLVRDSSSISMCSSSKMCLALSQSWANKWSRTLKFIRLLAPGYKLAMFSSVRKQGIP